MPRRRRCARDAAQGVATGAKERSRRTPRPRSGSTRGRARGGATSCWRPDVAVPAALLEDLRALARKHGSLALVAGCAEFLQVLALEGVKARLAERASTEEPCPRCRRREGLLKELEENLGRTTTADPQGAAVGTSEEE